MSDRYQDFLVSGWPYNETDKSIIERWRAAGRQGLPSQRTVNHIRYRLMFESDRFQSVEDATRDWFPEPEPLPLPTPSGKLYPLHVKAGSRFFYQKGESICDYREATAMGIYSLWLNNQRDKVEELFDYFKTNKFTAIRVLLNLDSDYWRAKERNNSYKEGDNFWSNLVPLIQCAERYGLYTRLCLFGGVEPFTEEKFNYNSRPDVITGRNDVIDRMHAFVEQTVGTTRDLDTVLYEVANEPSQIGFGKNSPVLIRLGGQIVRLAPNHLMNYGCANDEDNLYYAKLPASFLDEHLPRKPDWDYLASIKRLINQPCTDQPTLPFVSGEWMNLGLGGTGTESTATAFATAAMLRLKHAIPSFHAHCLLGGTLPDPKTDACVKAWTKGLDLISPTVIGSQCNGHWASSPFDKDIFPPTEEDNKTWRGPVRIFGRVKEDGSYIGLSIREPLDYDLVGEDGRELRTIHLEQWGDWQCRLVRA